MKTFVITQVRKNAKDEWFEVKTKMQFRSMQQLIRHLETTTNILWNAQCAVHEDGDPITKKYTGKKEMPDARC